MLSRLSSAVSVRSGTADLDVIGPDAVACGSLRSLRSGNTALSNEGLGVMCVLSLFESQSEISFSPTSRRVGEILARFARLRVDSVCHRMKRSFFLAACRGSWDHRMLRPAERQLCPWFRARLVAIRQRSCMGRRLHGFRRCRAWCAFSMLISLPFPLCGLTLPVCIA